MRKQENETPKKILDAAFRLVARDGYAKVSMRDVAREAEVSVSQIAYHFKNKEGLFSALMRALKESVAEDFSSGLGQVSDAGAFADFLCGYARESISRNIELHRLRIELSNLAINSSTFRAEIAAANDELAEMLASRIEGCEPPLMAAAGGARRAARFIISLIVGVSTQYLVSGRDERALEAIDVLRGVLG